MGSSLGKTQKSELQKRWRPTKMTCVGKLTSGSALNKVVLTLVGFGNSTSGGGLDQSC